MTMKNEPACCLEPAGRILVMRKLKGNVAMLNLLRFREVADYSATPDLAPETPISGADAYNCYIAHTMPHLKASGGELLFLGEPTRF